MSNKYKIIVVVLDGVFTKQFRVNKSKLYFCFYELNIISLKRTTALCINTLRLKLLFVIINYFTRVFHNFFYYCDIYIDRKFENYRWLKHSSI